LVNLSNPQDPRSTFSISFIFPLREKRKEKKNTKSALSLEGLQKRKRAKDDVALT